VEESTLPKIRHGSGSLAVGRNHVEACSHGQDAPYAVYGPIASPFYAALWPPQPGGRCSVAPFLPASTAAIGVNLIRRNKKICQPKRDPIRV
jgi:hypothetical protein